MLDNDLSVAPMAAIPAMGIDQSGANDEIDLVPPSMPYSPEQTSAPPPLELELEHNQQTSGTFDHLTDEQLGALLVANCATPPPFATVNPSALSSPGVTDFSSCTDDDVLTTHTCSPFQQHTGFQLYSDANLFGTSLSCPPTPSLPPWAPFARHKPSRSFHTGGAFTEPHPSPVGSLLESPQALAPGDMNGWPNMLEQQHMQTHLQQGNHGEHYQSQPSSPQQQPVKLEQQQQQYAPQDDLPPQPSPTAFVRDRSQAPSPHPPDLAPPSPAPGFHPWPHFHPHPQQYEHHHHHQQRQAELQHQIQHQHEHLRLHQQQQQELQQLQQHQHQQQQQQQPASPVPEVTFHRATGHYLGEPRAARHPFPAAAARPAHVALPSGVAATATDPANAATAPPPPALLLLSRGGGMHIGTPMPSPPPQHCHHRPTFSPPAPAPAPAPALPPLPPPPSAGHSRASSAARCAQRNRSRHRRSSSGSNGSSSAGANARRRAPYPTPPPPPPPPLRLERPLFRPAVRGVERTAAAAAAAMMGGGRRGVVVVKGPGPTSAPVQMPNRRQQAHHHHHHQHQRMWTPVPGSPGLVGGSAGGGNGGGGGVEVEGGSGVEGGMRGGGGGEDVPREMSWSEQEQVQGSTALVMGMQGRLWRLAEECEGVSEWVLRAGGQVKGEGGELERKRIEKRNKNFAVTDLDEPLEPLPRSAQPENEGGEKCVPGDINVPRTAREIRDLDYDSTTALLEAYGIIAFQPDMFLGQKKELYLHFIGVSRALMHLVLD